MLFRSVKTSYSSLEDGSQVVSAFCSFPDENPRQEVEATGRDKIARIEKLITRLLSRLEQENEQAAYNQMPVFWLLPELSREPWQGQGKQNDESQYLLAWASRLKQSFPLLFTHELSQFFPFGRAALPMALTTVTALFNKVPDIPGVCLIAVDSLYHDINALAQEKQLITAESESGIIPSEGAIFTCIKPANQPGEQGIAIDLAAQESTTIKQRSQGIESLFLKVDQALAGQQDKISTLYMPGNGIEALQQPWLDAYLRLADCLEARAGIKQSALFTGELGCVTGLYNLLHIYNGFEQQELTGNVVQLEQSQSLYQAIALYSWQE